MLCNPLFILSLSAFFFVLPKKNAGKKKRSQGLPPFGNLGQRDFAAQKPYPRVSFLCSPPMQTFSQIYHAGARTYLQLLPRIASENCEISSKLFGETKKNAEIIQNPQKKKLLFCGLFTQQTQICCSINGLVYSFISKDTGSNALAFV